MFGKLLRAGMSELTSHYRDRQSSLLQAQTAPCQLGALQCEGCPTHTALLVLAGRAGWITEQPLRACCSFTEVRKGRSQAQTSLPFKGPTLRLKTSFTLAQEAQGCHREPAAQGTQCHEDAQHLPANTIGLLSKHCVFLPD